MRRRGWVVAVAVIAWFELTATAGTIAVGDVHAEVDVADEAGAVTLLVLTALAGPDATLVPVPPDLTIGTAPALLTKESIGHAVLMELSRDGTGLRLTLAIVGADGSREISYVRAGDGDVATLAQGAIDRAVSVCKLTTRTSPALALGPLRPYATAIRLQATPAEAAGALADAVPTTSLTASAVTKVLATLPDKVTDPTLAAIAARALRDGKKLGEIGAGTDAIAIGARALAALVRSATKDAEAALGKTPPRNGLVTLAQVTLAEIGSDDALLEQRIKLALVGDQVRPVLALASTLSARLSPAMHKLLVAAADKHKATIAPGVVSRIALNAAERGVEIDRALGLVAARELDTYELRRLEKLVEKRTDVTALRLRAEISMRRADGFEGAAVGAYFEMAGNDTRAQRYQGWQLASEGKWVEAAALLEKAGALRERTRVLIAAGDPKGALAVIRAQAVTAEDYVIVMHVALAENRKPDAIAAAQQAERLGPVNPFVHRALLALDKLDPNPVRTEISTAVVSQGTGVKTETTKATAEAGSAVETSSTTAETGPSLKLTSEALDPVLLAPLLGSLEGLMQLRHRKLVIVERTWKPTWYSFKTTDPARVRGGLVKALSAPPYRLKLSEEPPLPAGMPTAETIARITGDADGVLMYELAASDRGPSVTLTFNARETLDLTTAKSVIKAPGLVGFNDGKLKLILAFGGVLLLAGVVYITRAKGRIKIKIERAPDVSDEVLCVEVTKSPTRPRVDDPAKFAAEIRKTGTVTKARSASLIASGYTFKVSTGQWYVHLYGAFARAGKMLVVPSSCTQELILERGQLAELKFDLTSKLAEVRIEVVATPRRGIKIWSSHSPQEKTFTDEGGEAVLELPVGTHTIFIETKARTFERQMQITAAKQHRLSINVDREMRLEDGGKIELPPDAKLAEVDNPAGPAAKAKTQAVGPAKTAAQVAMARTTPLPASLAPAPASSDGIKISDLELGPSDTALPPKKLARAQTPRPGEMLLERYRIKSELGRGAMGVVHRAWDEKLEREVAIKEMADDLRNNPEAMRLFTQEAKALAQLNHTNIVAMYDQVTDASGVYMIMEFVDGKPLADIAAARGAIPWREAVQIVDQVLAGLAYAHARKVIHRDIKPANCFVATDRTVKLGDFGLARVMREVTIRRTEIRGTPLYMAPEQITGTNVDHRADLYAVGCMLFELLTGRPPFIDGDILYAQMHLPPPSVANLADNIPPALDELQTSLLAKQADDRPGSANEVRTAFKQLLGLA